MQQIKRCVSLFVGFACLERMDRKKKYSGAVNLEGMNFEWNNLLNSEVLRTRFGNNSLNLSTVEQQL